jgi:glycosyltransferase involved in cell wall biosynthesis
LPDPSVAVVITTCNHAHFLGEALASVAAQTVPPNEVVVVDDGSDDDPAAVVANWPAAGLIVQQNQGLAVARNTGLGAIGSDFVLFLDADDRLAPNAVAGGLACFARFPEAAFVYGAHRRVNGEGSPLGDIRFDPVGDDPFADLLSGNLIGMHATVLYRRDILLRHGGFRPALKRCEDYDAYLRLARQYPVACHSELVAEYRWHGGNMSGDHRAMLSTVLALNRAHRPAGHESLERRRAWRRGRRNWRDYYLRLTLDEGRAAGQPRWRRVLGASRLSPLATLRQGFWAVRQSLRRGIMGREAPKPGEVDLGDLNSTNPISQDFGWDRGLPIDRFYIEEFLGRHSNDIRGRVLEVGDASYSRRYGGAKIEQQDVLHVHPGHREATIVGDLSQAGVLPIDTFDCIVLTQTLHLIFDIQAAVERLHASLKPEGVLLLTVPFISPIDRGEWGKTWYWGFTPEALRRTLTDVFGRGSVSVEGHGNVFAATAFLQGLAVAEVDTRKLQVRDEAYPMLVVARAVRVS